MYYTIEEILISERKHIPPSFAESVRDADYSLGHNEYPTYALMTSFSINEKTYSGVVAITPITLLFCSSINHNMVRVSFPLSEGISIGSEKGFLRKQLPINCANTSVIVKAPASDIVRLRNALLEAIEKAPRQEKDIYLPHVFTQDATTYKKVQNLKNAHRNERRLTKAESANFGKCPNCNGTVLVAKNTHVYCLKCQHDFGPIQK